MPATIDPSRKQHENASSTGKPAVAHGVAGSEDDKDGTENDGLVKLSAEEEAKLQAEATAHKVEANALFGRGQYDAALTAYETAIAVLPSHCDYDLAVLHSNVAACYLKTESWKEAIRAATAALEALERDKGKADQQDKKPKGTDEDVEEIVSAGAATAAPAPPLPGVADRERIRAKALLRRGRARSELGGWANLAGAEEDYKALAAVPSSSAALAAGDRRLVQAQLRQLPARTKAAQEQEMGEMWGKLKELGNGILRPFGMSTDNFQMTKDDKSGGYSMNFRPSGQ